MPVAAMQRLTRSLPPGLGTFTGLIRSQANPQEIVIRMKAESHSCVVGGWMSRKSASRRETIRTFVHNVPDSLLIPRVNCEF